MYQCTRTHSGDSDRKILGCPPPQRFLEREILGQWVRGSPRVSERATIVSCTSEAPRARRSPRTPVGGSGRASHGKRVPAQVLVRVAQVRSSLLNGRRAVGHSTHIGSRSHRGPHNITEYHEVHRGGGRCTLGCSCWPPRQRAPGRPNHYCVELLELPIGVAHYGAHGVRRPLAALQDVPQLPRARVRHRGDSDGRARPRLGAGVLVECAPSGRCSPHTHVLKYIKESAFRYGGQIVVPTTVEAGDHRRAPRAPHTRRRAAAYSQGAPPLWVEASAQRCQSMRTEHQTSAVRPTIWAPCPF